ncbi:MAG: SRPBCC family protein [Acidimicrobiia bacterium]
MHFEHSIEIAAPVERVWALTVDVESWPSVTPTMTKIERLDPGTFGVGSRARVRQPAQGARVWTVTRLDAPEWFVWETRALGLRMVGSHHVVPTDGGCRNVLTIDVSGRGAGIFARLLGGRVAAAVTTENESFKAAAELG